jgi:hypothetical protein
MKTMKNKLCFYLCLIVGLGFGFFNNVRAQGGVEFDSGILITVKTETVPVDSANSIRGNVVYVGATKNIMHRIITDWKNKLFFGYDIVVAPQPEKNKFKLSFKPLSINPSKYVTLSNSPGVDFHKPPVEVIETDKFATRSLPKYPDDMLVEDGDTITLELLENPQTKIKISDVIKIAAATAKGGDIFSDKKPPRDFTIDDVELQLTKLEVFVNSEKIGIGGGGMSGANIYIYLPDKGRFIMSPFPRKGFNFQKIGIVENNKISFTFNGDNYKFVSATPVLGLGGKWNIWILHDADYRSSYNLSPNSYEQGAADKIEFLFNKQRQ